MFDRFGIAARHAAGSNHGEHFGIRPRQILRAETGAGAHAHVLQIAVVHERERLGVARAEQKNQAAVAPPFHAVFVFDHEAVLVFPG